MGWISQVDIRNLRCLTQVKVDLHPGLNLLYGDNGAGKTSFLEALCYVSRGCGTAPQLRDLTGPASDTWSVDALVDIGKDIQTRMHHVAYRRGKRQQTISGSKASNVQLARSLPLASLAPIHHAVLSEGAATRMRWIDWCMFHVEPSFLQTWRDYRRTLKQRNKLLKKREDGESLHVWTQALAENGEKLAHMREHYVKQWNPLVEVELKNLQTGGAWRAQLRRGWEARKTLLQSLQETQESDLSRGTTGRGPHRADWVLSCNGQTARRRVSRGEEKISAIALLMILLEQVLQATRTRPALLVDDFPAELSPEAQNRILSRMKKWGGQIVLTAHECKTADQEDFFDRMFHVEHGRISQI